MSKMMKLNYKNECDKVVPNLMNLTFSRATIAHLLKPQLFPTKEQLQPADDAMYVYLK